jgi:hypothetical protein
MSHSAQSADYLRCWCPEGLRRAGSGSRATKRSPGGLLARTTWQKLVAGQTAADVYPEAVADADRAFALLATGTCDATDVGS